MHDVMFKSSSHMIHVPLEHEAVLTQFNNIEYLCTLDQSGSHTSDWYYSSVCKCSDAEVDIVPECYCWQFICVKVLTWQFLVWLLHLLAVLC